MIVKAIKTGIFREGENLFDFVVNHIKKVPEKSVIVITSKIVALSEGRTVVIENKKTRVKYIRKESEIALSTKFVWLTVKDNMIMANAGIDESNANGKLILLPKNSFKSAAEIRRKLQKKFGVKNLGVLITDSRTVPLRAGVTGVALGYAGFRGIKDYIGMPDIFGRKFLYSRSNMADALATAAVMLMGEGSERKPLAIISDAPVTFQNKISPSELKIKISDDLYRPLFSKLLK